MEYTTIKTKDNKTLKIKIDRDLCIGAASCAAIAPNTYALDDSNIAVLIQNTEYDDLETVLAGAMSCPVLAIIILDENDKQLFPEV